MNLTPNLNVTRLAQLKPGELFFLLDHRFSILAMLVVEPEQGGDANVLLFGPNLPDGIAALHVMSWDAETAVSLGNNYRLVLPVSPASWTKEPLELAVPCVAIADNKVYFRVNYRHYSASPRSAYVSADDGKLSYNRPTGILAFARDWRLETIEAPEKNRTIF